MKIIKQFYASIILTILFLCIHVVIACAGMNYSEANTNIVNVDDGYISVTGEAVGRNGTTGGQQKLTAISAAKIIAQRRLFELIGNIKITENETIKDLEFKSDVVKTAITGLIRAARVTNQKWIENVATVEIQICLGTSYKCSSNPNLTSVLKNALNISDLSFLSKGNSHQVIHNGVQFTSEPLNNKPQSLSAPPNLVASVNFSEPSGNNILDAEETGKLTVNVENNGKGDAFDVSLELAASKYLAGITYNKKVNVGKIEAGKIVSKEIPLNTTDDLPTDNLSFTIEVKEANGFDAQPSKISFNTHAFEPPSLVVADIGINDQNGGTKVEPGKLIDVVARIQNIGRGEAHNVMVDVQKGDNVFFGPDSQTHFEIGSLVSGKFTDIKFQFLTNNRIKNGDSVPLSIKLSESHPRYGASRQLALVMNAPQKSAQEFVVKATEQEHKASIQLAGGLSIDVDTNIPEGKKAGEYDIAVVIGNKSYSLSGSPDVEYAVHDAQMMKEYLTRTMGFQPDNIIYEENASLSKFNEIFGTERNYKGKLFKHVKAGESRVFVYYVGHGAPDLETQDAYLVPVDANPQYLRDNGYRLQTFYDNLAKIPATRMTVILDSCFSGNSEKGMLFKGMSPALVKVKKELRGPDKATVITSAGTDQISVWYPEKRHSLFTYYFLKGISGDADYNKDGKIDVGEMKRYLADKVPYMANRLKGYDQQPVVNGDPTDVLAVLIK
jgi:hypothetical protein